MPTVLKSIAIRELDELDLGMTEIKSLPLKHYFKCNKARYGLLTSTWTANWEPRGMGSTILSRGTEQTDLVRKA